MMIKIFKYLGFYALAIWLIGISSCSEMDDFKKFGNGKELSYPGKVDSVKIFSGRNRIKLRMLFISDPKVSKVKIYWGNRSDSTESAITKTAGIDTLYLLVPNLPEGTYNFEIYTYDQDGNKSISVLATGKAYGAYYENSLINRQISAVNWKVGGNTFITWGATDSASLGTKIKFSDNSGTSHTMVIPNKEKTTELANFDATSKIEYQTMFKPDSLCIDTFYATAQTKGIDGIALKNPGPSFSYIAGTLSGRYADLADWTFNTAIQNHSSPFLRGGYDTENGGCIAMEGWYNPDITNGKIYQTISLPAGSYKFIATVANIDGTMASYYIVAAEGSTVPNVADIATALGSYQVTNVKGDLTVSFSLSQTTEVSLGFVATIVGSTSTGVRVSKVQLVKN